jgi:ATP-dependent RNA helicase RhlE
MSFDEFGLHPELLKAVRRMGFEQPTPIQQMAIPPALQSRDVLAAAMTGSGKTAAFLLPILHHLAPKKRGMTRALVVAPTRELAAQIAEHLADLAGQTGITGAAVYGGVAMGPQEQAFRRGVDVIVATPGRLLDHLQYSYAKLNTIEYVVLDEADRMLDMGFLPDVRRILGFVPKARRTYLFSATLPEAIVSLAEDFLKDPVALNVERKSAPPAAITHTAYPVPHELKSHLLLALLGQDSARTVLAFTRTKHRADRLADFLQRRGIAAARIHGNRSQAQRTEAMAGFKAGRYRVLVATDIAARGIDVEALGLVVNFDVPPVPEDYIHRVGRTARAEATGDAYTLVSRDEEHDLRAIESHIGKRLPRQLVAGFDYEKRPAEKLEVPLHERIAAIRSRKREERSRAQANSERRNARGVSGAPAAGARSGGYAPRGSQGSRALRGPGVSRMGAGLAWLREIEAQKERGAVAGGGTRRSFGR